MLRKCPIDRINEQQIGLARLQTRFQNSLPELPGIDFASYFIGLRTAQRKHRAGPNCVHEGVCDIDAMMKVETFAVEVTGWLADLKKLLNLWMMNIEIDRRGTAAQRTLADRKRQPVHDMNERNDSGSLASLHRFPDRAHLSPIGPDAAAA